MAKFNIGDIVRYTNKNDHIDVFGEITAIMRDTWSYNLSALIEPLDEKYYHPRLYRHTIARGVNYTFDQNKFEATGVTTYRGKRPSLWAPMKSKNLVFAYPPKDYDPSQNGDKDDDI